MKIGITSIGTATSVGLIKNIRKYDNSIEIIGMDINAYGYTAGSLMVDKYYCVPYAIDIVYLQRIIEIVKKENLDLLIPINDIEIEEIVKNKEQLDSLCEIIVPSLNVINLVRNKYKMNLFAYESGISVPMMDELPYDEKCIVRDKFGVGSKGIKIYNSFSKVKINDEGKFVQKYIEGDEYTVDVLSDINGKPVFIIPRRRIEVKSGVATKVEITKDESLIKDAEKIINRLKIPGFSNIQFIKDANGINWFVEVNPRIGGCSNSSLLAAPKMFEVFMKIATNTFKDNIKLNSLEVKWDSIVTRYYEDILYEK